MGREGFPGAGPWVPDRLSLSSIRTHAEQCRGCELYQDATQVVMGDGPESAALMVVGEQPGDKKDRVGEPFVGPAGGRSRPASRGCSPSSRSYGPGWSGSSGHCGPGGLRPVLPGRGVARPAAGLAWGPGSAEGTGARLP